MPGEASFATVTSSLAVCFFPRGTWAPRSSPARGPVIFSGRSVISVNFPLTPGTSKMTALASERFRPSTVKMAVLPSSIPAGEILVILGGMMGSSANRDRTLNIPSEKDIAKNKALVLIFTSLLCHLLVAVPDRGLPRLKGHHLPSYFLVVLSVV